jgi:hypothetical protein
MASRRPAQLFALCAFVVLTGFVVLGFVVLGAGRVAGSTCQTSCNDGGPTVLHTTSNPAPTPCVRDVGCGGGGALSSSAAPIVAVLGAAGLVAAALMTRRRRWARRLQPVGVLLASTLYRPPRALFGI